MNNSDWSIEDNYMKKEFIFPSSKAASKFMDRLGELFEQEQNFPFVNQKSKIVSIKISINSPVDMEEKNIRLANLINKIG